MGVVLAVAVGTGCSRTVDCVGPDCVADETGGSEEGDEPGLPIPYERNLDILFVIDNSGSMGMLQARLATNAAALIDVLEAEDVEVDYRIGITTTDNGNPWCQQDTTSPEYGQLVLSSCTARPDDFMFNVGQSPLWQDACLDICALEASELEILPTTTHVDPEAKPRPWLERIGGLANIPEGTAMADALACFLFPIGSRVTAECALDEFPDVTCPGIGG